MAPPTKKRTPTKKPTPMKKRARESSGGDKKRQEFLQTVRHWNKWRLLGDHPEYQDDKEVVEVAVRNDAMALQFASQRLRNSQELVTEAVKKSVNVFQYASDALKDDKQFCQEMLAFEFLFASPYLTLKLFQHMSPRIRNDKDIAQKAVGIYGLCLEYASPELRSDPEVVMAAVSNIGGALRYASNELLTDKQIVMAAMKNRSSRLWGNHFELLNIISKELQDDEEVVEAALKGHGAEIRYASDRLQNNPKMLALALREFRTVNHNDAVQRVITQDDRCLGLKDRLSKLKSTLAGCKFPVKRYNPRRMTPKGLTDRMVADMVHRKWCIHQVVVGIYGMPPELCNRIFDFSGNTSDDDYVIHEIRELGPFLVEGSDKFYPRYASWWVFLTGKATGWFEKK